MVTHGTLTATAMLALLASTNALALETGFYIGAVAGQTKVDANKSEYDAGEREPFATNFSSSMEDSDTALGIFLGGQFGRWFALEAQLAHLGEFKYNATQTVTNVFPTAPRNVDTSLRSTSEAAAATLSGILTVPVGDRVAFGFRLGVAVSATESSYEYVARRGNTVFYSESDGDDTADANVSPTYGISVEWDPTSHFGVRLEYQRITDVGAEDGDEFEEEVDGVDVDVLSLSLIGRF